MDDELGEAVSVMVMSNTDLAEVAFRRRLGALAVEEPVAQGRELVVLGGRTAGWDGIRPLLYPPRLPELLEPVLDAAGASERGVGECLAQLEELEDGQRAPIESDENLDVALGEVSGEQ